jgi:hypothetical protein
MFDFWMILVPGGILALLIGVVLVILKKTRRLGLVILAAGVALSCAGVLRAWHIHNVTMSVAKVHRQVQNGMSKAEVKTLLGPPEHIASADATGKLQVPWEGRKDLDISEAVLAWEYRPFNRIHCYRVYFDVEGRVIGKAAE